jgi:hypothetical protein
MRIEPKIADCNQRIAGENQRQSISHPRKHAERLAKMLHALGARVAGRLQQLAAAAAPHTERAWYAFKRNAAQLSGPA